MYVYKNYITIALYFLLSYIIIFDNDNINLKHKNSDAEIKDNNNNIFSILNLIVYLIKIQMIFIGDNLKILKILYYYYAFHKRNILFANFLTLKPNINTPIETNIHPIYSYFFQLFKFIHFAFFFFHLLLQYLNIASFVKLLMYL